MNTDTPSSPPKATRNRLLQFGLRELLLAVVLVAALAALWRQYQEAERLRAIVQAYDLAQDRSDLSAGNFRVDVKDVFSGSNDSLAKQVVIEFLDGAKVMWSDGEGSSASVDLTPPSPRSGRLMHAEVNVITDLIETRGSDTNLFRQLVQISAEGGCAGGPGLYPVPKDKQLKDLVELRIQPGVYRRGQSLELGKINGRTLRLTVK